MFKDFNFSLVLEEQIKLWGDKSEILSPSVREIIKDLDHRITRIQMILDNPGYEKINIGTEAELSEAIRLYGRFRDKLRKCHDSHRHGFKVIQVFDCVKSTYKEAYLDEYILDIRNHFISRLRARRKAKVAHSNVIHVSNK
jgi:hypothetical protein